MKKGFTLVELLAVILLLAIIALIAVPILFGTIEKVKFNAIKDSSYGYVDAIEKQVAFNIIEKNSEITDGLYTVGELSTLGVKVKGTKPVDGKIQIKNKQVTCYILNYDDYSVKTANECSNEIIEDVPNEIVVPTISKGQTEITPIIKGENILDKTNNYLQNSSVYNYMGGTYLKGNQLNNYVWYNGFLWRIMGKNSDNTIRLITEESISGISWGSGSASTYTSTGYINDWLNNYFYNNLNDTKRIIQKYDFCYEAASSSTTLRTNCTAGNTVNKYAGIISLDEYNLSMSANNSYLTNGVDFWSMTRIDGSYAWSIYYDGISKSNSYYAFGVRPVINVSSTTIITSGTGAINDAFVLEQSLDEKYSKGKELSKAVSNGEYVSLENKTYRVITKNEQGVKLIYDGYYGSTTTFGSTSKFENSTIDKLLNNQVLSWLELTSSDKIVTANWNYGKNFNLGNQYSLAFEDNATPIARKVGLIRFGELLCAQSASVLTDGYIDTTGKDNYKHTKTYWTLSYQGSSDRAWYVSDTGHSMYYLVSNNYGVRPVIYAKSNLIINSGNGTYQNPYKV